MKHINIIQQCLWFAFLLVYIAMKFLAGGGAYSHDYALQVGIIVGLTAVIPFYALTWLTAVLPKLRLSLLLLAPTLLAMTGYAVFFGVFIAPNYPDIAAAQVIVRGVMPGLVISAVLVLPIVVSWLSQRQQEVA